jgi:hypothetical protein
MKRVAIFMFLVVVLTSTDRDDFYNPSGYFPILMEREQLEKSVMYRDAQEIINPGKIYYKDGFIFLNEKYKGIHVINNADPSDPQNVGFINIPGCVDMAIKNNSLMADNAVDLVTVNIKDFPQIAVTSRIKNAFPESTPPDETFIPYMFSAGNRPANTIIVGWERPE